MPGDLEPWIAHANESQLSSFAQILRAPARQMIETPVIVAQAAGA
jgi:hypothetical protein